MKTWDDPQLYTDPDYCLEFLAGLPDCAGRARGQKRIFHAYWHGIFGAKQALSLKSFLATQDLSKSEVWIWTEGMPSGIPAEENRFLAPMAGMIRVLPFSLAELTPGTPFQPDPGIIGILGWRKRALLNGQKDLVHRSNLIRYLILYRFGGVYFDLDVLFLRDWNPLFEILGEAEFCYQWSSQPYCNTAILALQKESAFLEHIMGKSLKKRAFSPSKLFAFDDNALDLLVLPCTVFDPLWLHCDGHSIMTRRPFDTFEDFFLPRPEPAIDIERFFPGSFAYHWHNQWTAPEIRNSFAGQFDRYFSERLRERFGVVCAPAFTEVG